MSIAKLRALITLATQSQEPAEAESAALQACRYIQEHRVELKLPDGGGTTEPKPKGEGWEQVMAIDEQQCSACGEPIERGDMYWKQQLQSHKRFAQRLHGGCV